MKLTVLGTWGAYPPAGGACCGYLVEEGATKLLLDCGPGVLANLQRSLSLAQITDVLISHMHPDHFLDLIPFRYALTHAWFLRGHRPRLHLPPQGTEILERLASSFSGAEAFFASVFDIREYGPSVVLNMGCIKLTFAPVQHYIPSYAIALTGAGKLVYSSDSAPCPELEKLAHKADLFLCEATLVLPETRGTTRGHMTAAEAGEMAQRAEVKRLILTHFWPELDPTLILSQASAAFSGAVEAAQVGQIYQL